MHNEIVTFQSMNGVWKPRWIQSVNEPRLSKYSWMWSSVCCAVPTYKRRATHTHTHTLFLLIAHLYSLAHAHSHTHTMHRAIRYTAAGSSFGLILSSYNDRPNKSEQRIFIHISVPLAWGLRHSRQSHYRVGLMCVLLWHQTWQGNTILTLLCRK